MQQVIEEIVAADRFSMRALRERVWRQIETQNAVSPHIEKIRNRLGRNYKKLAAAILRSAFLIELVRVPKIETTKFRVRWCSQLSGDQRRCDFNECMQIAIDLITVLAEGWLDKPKNEEILRLCFKHSVLPYEAPIDYATRPAFTDRDTRIHRSGNVVWIASDVILRTLKLRQYMTKLGASPDAAFSKKVSEDKLKVKTYLTDRVLTGEHKTNREKRWEVHPHSVHFALRQTCMEIEYTLIKQLCAFQGFPENYREILQKEKLLPDKLETFCCPITLDPMSFSDFRDELMNPIHGKANFQVGHLNPLKLDEATGATGHTAQNISWISADGNRIQGSLSLGEVRKMLKRIARNYEVRGWK